MKTKEKDLIPGQVRDFPSSVNYWLRVSGDEKEILNRWGLRARGDATVGGTINALLKLAAF